MNMTFCRLIPFLCAYWLDYRTAAKLYGKKECSIQWRDDAMLRLPPECNLSIKQFFSKEF